MRDYVCSCPICQRTKDRTTRTPGLLKPLLLPSARFSEYSLDFIFGLPVCQGMSGILTVVDRATKRVILRAVPESISADQVSAILFDGVVRLFGVPSILLSDHDPRFMSDVWAGLMQCLGTSLIHSMAHHP